MDLSDGQLLFDETHNDPTIRRCIGFAESWGHSRLVVANLFAYRATHPKDLKATRHPIGADNDRVLLEEARNAQTVLLGWGVHGVHRNRNIEVLDLFDKQTLYCLGVTKEGHPKHPLYLRSDTPLQAYERK